MNIREVSTGYWRNVLAFFDFWSCNNEREATPITPLSGSIESECEKPLPTPSLDGEYAMRDEVRRQLLLVGFVPDPYRKNEEGVETAVNFWAASHYQDLDDAEKNAVDARTKEGIRLGIAKPRGIKLRDLEIQERTGRAVYDDIYGYIPERELAAWQPAPKWYNLQTYIHARDMMDLSVVDHFGEASILGMANIREVLETREMMQLLDRVKESTGNYPTAAKMGIVSGNEAVCESHIVRQPTTTEHRGYDAVHAEDYLQTVKKHNAFIGNLTSVSAQQAKDATEEHKIVLWNAGGSGKHYIVDVVTQAVL